MVKVTFTVEGDTDEVIAAIRRLAVGDAALPGAPEPDETAVAANGSSPTAAPAPAPLEPEVPEGNWDMDHVRAFWGFLAPDARDIYRQVAQGNGYVLSREALLETMNLTARELSGRLSSQGHAVRRIRRHHNVSLPHPMSFDSQSQEYRMRPDVADAIVRLTL
jgi:hypothetical protein